MRIIKVAFSCEKRLEQTKFLHKNKIEVMIFWVVVVGGVIRPLPRDEGAEELHGIPTVGPRPKVWTRGQK